MNIPSNATHHDRPERFQILALDGGGVKALFTAHVLAHLEDDLGVSIRDTFDLVAGTSAGGIIALALGAGLRPIEIAERFEELAADVFPRRRRRRLRIPYRLVRATYDQATLKQALTDMLGDRLLGDSDKRLVIPSYDLLADEVHLFKTPHHGALTRDWRVPMVDVALATTAAPTILPAARLDGQRLVDGGVWANNPSVIAIAEAMSVLEVPLDAIRVLNIGTTNEVARRSKRLDRGGWLQWMKPAVPTVLAATSRGTRGTAMHLLGKDDFEAFDVDVPGGLYGLDAADFDELAGLAYSRSRVLSPTFREKFANHQALPYVPFHSTANLLENAS